MCPREEWSTKKGRGRDTGKRELGPELARAKAMGGLKDGVSEKIYSTARSQATVGAPFLNTVGKQGGTEEKIRAKKKKEVGVFGKACNTKMNWD